MRNFLAHFASSFGGAFVLGECVTLFIDHQPLLAAEPLGTLFLVTLLLPLVYVVASFLSAFLRAAELNTFLGWLVSGLAIGLALGAIACLTQQAVPCYTTLAVVSLSAMSSALIFWLVGEWQPNPAMHTDLARKAARGR